MRALITWPTTQGCNFHSPLSKTGPCRTPAAPEPFWLVMFSKINGSGPRRSAAAPSALLGSKTSMLHLVKNIPPSWRPPRPCTCVNSDPAQTRRPAPIAKPSPAGSGYSRWTRQVLRCEATCDKYRAGTTDGIFFFFSPILWFCLTCPYGEEPTESVSKGEGNSRGVKISYWLVKTANYHNIHHANSFSTR